MGKKEEIKDNDKGVTEEKINKIIKKAKDNGKITYGELANELVDVNPKY